MPDVPLSNTGDAPFDRARAAREGLYDGLIAFGQALIEAGRPRLILREGYGPGLLGGLGQGFAAFGRGMDQGRQGAINRHLQDRALQREDDWSAAFSNGEDGALSPRARALRDAAPAELRGVLGLAGPQAGLSALLDAAKSERDRREIAGVLGRYGLGGAGGAAAADAPAPAGPGLLDAAPRAGTGLLGTGPAPMPEGAAQPAAAGGAGPSGDMSLPRGLRNNNPLNIIDAPFTRGQAGYQGTDGRFARFGSMDEGIAAADRLLTSYAQRGLTTPAAIINRWAPPSENNTSGYAANVARALGVEPDAQLDMNNPAVRRRLIEAMAVVENGRPLPAGGAPAPSGPATVPTAGGPVTTSGAGGLIPQGASEPFNPRTMVRQAEPEPFNPRTMVRQGQLETRPIGDPGMMREAQADIELGRRMAPPGYQPTPYTPPWMDGAALPVQAGIPVRPQAPVPPVPPVPGVPGVPGAAGGAGPVGSAGPVGGIPPNAAVALMLEGAIRRNPTLMQLGTGLAQLQNRESTIQGIGPGQTLFRNGVPVGTTPERPTETQQLFQRFRDLSGRANLTPVEQEERELLRQRLGGQTTIDRGPNAYDTARGQELAKVVQGIEAAGRAAPSQAMRLNTLEANLNRFQTGAASGARITVGNIAQQLGVPDTVLQSLGIDRNTVAAGETIRSLTFQMIQGQLASGEFPSQNFSNADLAALQQASPSLFNSEAGNRALVGIQRALTARNAEVAKAWRDWQRTNGDSIDSTRRFLNERLPEITSQDILDPLLKDFRGEPAQPVDTPRAAPNRDLNPAAGPGGRGTAATPPAAAQPRPRARNARGEEVEFDPTANAWVPVR